MGHTWCLQKIVVCHKIPVNGAYLTPSRVSLCHQILVNGAYWMPSKDICLPSDSCEWGLLYAFKRYMYAIIFLWMGHTVCLQKISVCHQIPVNGAYCMLSKDICMQSDSCEWGILYAFKRYLYAIRFLWMGHTWYFHKIILIIYVSFKRP